MDKVSLSSTRFWAILCCYAFFAYILGQNFSFGILVYLTIPTTAVIIIKFKEEFWIKMLCLSAFASSVFWALVCSIPELNNPVNAHTSVLKASTNQILLPLLYFIFILPLLYSFIKDKDWRTRTGIILIGIVLSPHLLGLITSNLFIIFIITNLLLKSFLYVALMGFFVSSAIGSSDMMTRCISIFVGICSVTLIICGLPMDLGLTKNLSPHAIFVISIIFSIVYVLEYVLIFVYSLCLFVRSHDSLKSLYIPTMIACVLMIVAEILKWNVWGMNPFILDRLYLLTITPAFVLFIVSFYKLQRKIATTGSIDNLLLNQQGAGDIVPEEKASLNKKSIAFIWIGVFLVIGCIANMCQTILGISESILELYSKPSGMFTTTIMLLVGVLLLFKGMTIDNVKNNTKASSHAAATGFPDGNHG